MVEINSNTMSVPGGTVSGTPLENLDINSALENFKGACPIFPLKNYVLFPKTGQTFRIFEPRYKEMIEDALSSDRFISIALLKRTRKSSLDPRPQFYGTGTLGYIMNSKTMDNGDFQVMVIGLKKVQIHEAIQTQTYRYGKVRILEDTVHFPQEDEGRERLLQKFTQLLNVSGTESRLNLLKNKLVDVEMLTNIVCSVYPVQKVEQQKLLELPEVGLRLDVLCHFIDSELKEDEPIEDYVNWIPDPSEWS